MDQRWDTGRLLRAARTAGGLSQRDLATKAGVPQSMISAYERGDRHPSVATLDRLLAAAGWKLTIGIERGDQAMDGNGRLTYTAIEDSLGSLALEGGTVSDELKAALYDIAAGVRTFDEVLAELYAKHDRSGRVAATALPT